MNRANNGKQYGFTQYCWPHSFELGGREFVLKSALDTYRLEFTADGFVNYSDSHGNALSQYEALKINDHTHIAFFGEYITTVVLDLETGLATISMNAPGEYDFCKIDGFKETEPLHGYTDEMTGTHVKWVFGDERYLENMYNGDGTCSCVWSPRTDRPRAVPAVYIRIADGVYLCELNRTSPFRTDMPQGFSKIVMLQSYDSLLTVGCIYSPTLNEFHLISGYAMNPEA